LRGSHGQKSTLVQTDLTIEFIEGNWEANMEKYMNKFNDYEHFKNIYVVKEKILKSQLEKLKIENQNVHKEFLTVENIFESHDMKLVKLTEENSKLKENLSS